MKKNILLEMILLIICVLFFTTGEVQAINADNLLLRANTTSFKAGETVELEVALQGITEENGIVLLNALLEYDQEVWEEVTVYETEAWNDLDCINNMITISTTNLEPITTDTTIMRIVLKAKENIEQGSTTVSLSNITVSDNVYQTSPLEDISIELTKLEEETNTPNPPGGDSQNGDEDNPGENQDTPNNSGDNNSSENGSNQNNSQNNSQNLSNEINNGDNMATGKLPQTGNMPIMIIVGTILCLILSYILHKKFKQYDDVK